MIIIDYWNKIQDIFSFGKSKIVVQILVEIFPLFFSTVLVKFFYLNFIKFHIKNIIIKEKIKEFFIGSSNNWLEIKINLKYYQLMKKFIIKKLI